MTHGSQQLDIESYLERFPFVAGHTAEGTSQEAAQTIEKSGRAAQLRTRCLKAIHESVWGLSADQVAEYLGESCLSIRPRISELRERGLIKKTAARRKNTSGMSASIWVPA